MKSLLIRLASLLFQTPAGVVEGSRGKGKESAARLLIRVLALGLLCTAFTTTGLAGQQTKSVHPNIVYILCDDLGYGDVQALNPLRGKIKTPCIDRLSTQGMTFTDAHGGSSVCTPSRYGLLTGRYAWRTHLQRGVLDGYVSPLIAPDRLTLPGFLKQNGYQTACIGKWHLGFTIEPAVGGATPSLAGGGRPGARLGAVTHDGPITRGFDSFFGFHHARMISSVFENDRVTQIVEPVDVLPALVKRSREQISAFAKSKNPFFLYLALNSPHTPIVPNADWKGKSGLGNYGDFVMETDWAVGEVLATLERAGVDENTLVVFTSDNGCSPAAGTAKLEAAGHFASAQYRGYKSDIWDGGHRVPFMVRWPGNVKAGSRSAQLICLNDFMATCAELLGKKLPDNAAEDSFSTLPVLLGTDKAPVRDSIVHHSIYGQFAIRKGPWKLELCAGSGGWSTPKEHDAAQAGLPKIQLYNLQTDESETTNVQADHPEIVASLSQLLLTTISNGRSTPGPKQANDIPIKLDEKLAPRDDP